MGGPEIEALIGQFARLPGLGPRSARRAVLRLLQQKEARLLPLIATLQAASAAVGCCRLCGNLDSTDPCAICRDERRDGGAICVVESVADLWALERALVHRGRYHVLGGVLSALAGTTPDSLNLQPLFHRLDQGGVTEVVLALGATVDGATTGFWLAERLRAWQVPVTRIAQGMPVGGAVEGLDEGTLAAALRSRRAV